VKLTRTHLFWAAMVLGGAALAYLLLLKPPPPPETLIRQKVVQMVRSAERKELGDMMEQISPAFRTADGLTRDELRGFLAGQLFRGQWVRIFLVDMEAQVKSPTTVELDAKFIFGRSDAKELKDLAKDSVMSSYQIQARAERESDGEWRFVWATYKPIDASQFL
jgi:hypothetical protein